MADKTSRRNFMKAITASSLAPYVPKGGAGTPQTGSSESGAGHGVERWGVYEVVLKSPARHSNPFASVTLSGHFNCGEAKITANGFYDGEGTWRIRLMPPAEGNWTYVTESNERDLDGKQGSFQCVAPGPANHGPVGVSKKVHFAFADGTPFFPLGTTLYNWVHREESLQEETLATLKTSPFNKARFCVFPKWYPFNRVEPPLYPYLKAADGKFDFTRFNPAYFRRFERRVRDLMELGIQADLILFHPYDKWGFSKMDPQQDDAYLRYAVSRLAAFRNVWWTMANEWDFIQPPKDWDHIFRTVQALDPSHHLRGIHNGYRWYNHAEPWVTHCVIQQQTDDCYSVALGARLRYNKPVVIDEYGYEGNNGDRWGNLSGRREMLRHWDFTMAGAYGSHGETYVHPGDILWWAVGGKLVGESPARLAFLKQILAEAPFQGLQP
ncbi:MAG: DUF5060 domain-containing protein, partial [Terriglobia bacterium]